MMITIGTPLLATRSIPQGSAAQEEKIIAEAEQSMANLAADLQVLELITPGEREKFLSIEGDVFQRQKHLGELLVSKGLMTQQDAESLPSTSLKSNAHRFEQIAKRERLISNARVPFKLSDNEINQYRAMPPHYAVKLLLENFNKPSDIFQKKE